MQGGGERPINLALQGGGAHGAFTWGVLDRLLEADVFAFEGVVGTSAGAVNAAALVHGLVAGGPAAARTALDTVWTRIADLAQANPLRQLDGVFGAHPALKPVVDLHRQIAYGVLGAFSPYQLNPFGINPLRDLLLATVDFAALQRQDRVKMFVNATDVATGDSRVFTEMEMSVEVVLASGCLPMIAHAVEIGGRHYWDGGFSANPPIYPLVYACETRDTLLVLITPMNGAAEPRTMDAITSRMNQITFTSTLRNELRHIRLLEHLRRNQDLTSGTWETVRLHMISAGDAVADLGWESMLAADRAQLLALRAKGREAADAFLARHLDDVGTSSTITW